jgi:tetraacyldisaccharide 4'-kinase
MPLVPLYGAGLRIKNVSFDHALLRSKKLNAPVISIGSLSAGGAGKTPVVIALAKLLIRQGIRPDVLSRGYGRQSREIAEVTPGGTARQFGDEPIEISLSKIRVFVGADRFAAGRLGESSHGGGVNVHLLDDGFQHRQLARDLDVVLLTKEDTQDRLLPAGNLREPFSSLRRADVIVLREEEAEELRPFVAQQTDAEIWIVRRRLIVPPQQPGRRWFAFCAIARPSGFVDSLNLSGITPVGSKFFPDHHAFTTEDLAAIAHEAQAAGATGFCTTMKDRTRIPHDASQAMLKVGPIWPAKLRATLLDEDAIVRRVRSAMKSA